MANDDDTGDGELETLDVQGTPSADHMRLRNIAHTLCHDLDVQAVVLVTLQRDGSVQTSTMLHCSIPDEQNPDVGAGLIRGLTTCAEQLRRALVHGEGNGGHDAHESEAN